MDVVWSDPTLKYRTGFIRSNFRETGPPREHYTKEPVTLPSSAPRLRRTLAGGL